MKKQTVKMTLNAIQYSDMLSLMDQFNCCQVNNSRNVEYTFYFNNTKDLKGFLKALKSVVDYK